ncbi:serine/threonine protein phosphatase [Candidatus Acetothermia bacterium]|nr:serine/threonine protein phosphatase [Candidatus Acetothermia bacterium]MBI3643914.1 serine/threonine protein phosphatase [Candidatus Acetothermia bacterium]
MNEIELLRQAHELFQNEPQLVQIRDAQRVVFIGDTHGDLEATQIVIERYFDLQTTLVFVGDYVDRGPRSAENINTLLEMKLENPKRVILLQGNHEAWKTSPFSPADFWENLSREQQTLYSSTLSKLPFAAALPNGVIALHGALPSVEKLQKINEIPLGSAEWRQITWGDWQHSPGQSLGDLGSRPQFGRDRFDTLMKSFGMNVLIRGHQPHAPLLLYDDRCLTIFTSSTYQRDRIVAIAESDKKIETARDLVIEAI